MNITPKEEYLPLTPTAFHVLLALAEKPMYGYGIFEQCEFDASGSVQFDRANLYRTILDWEAARHQAAARLTTIRLALPVRRETIPL